VFALIVYFVFFFAKYKYLHITIYCLWYHTVIIVLINQLTIFLFRFIDLNIILFFLSTRKDEQKLVARLIPIFIWFFSMSMEFNSFSHSIHNTYEFVHHRSFLRQRTMNITVVYPRDRFARTSLQFYTYTYFLARKLYRSTHTPIIFL